VEIHIHLHHDRPIDSTVAIEQLQELRLVLNRSMTKLKTALRGTDMSEAASVLPKEFTQVDLEALIAKLKADVEAATTVTESAVTYIKAVPQMIKDAVAQASAAGATPEQLAVLSELANTLETESGNLQTALTANVTEPEPVPVPDPNNP
jgi:hypothetical protein